MFNKFIQLVNKFSAREHNLDFYASELCVTPRYMSTIVKGVSGKSAKEWIDKSMLTTIEIALRHSNKTAAEIAFDMNFPNTSFFSKYFKRLTGMTPMEYRKKS